MKWDATERKRDFTRVVEDLLAEIGRAIASRGSFTFTNADALVAFAQAHGRLVRGHTLGMLRTAILTRR